MRLPILFLTLLIALSARAEIRVPAFTAYSDPDMNEIRIRASDGISQWTDPTQRVLWFGDLKHAGKLTAALVLSVPKGRESRLELTVGKEASAKTIVGADGEQTVSFGAFEVPEPGCVRFSLRSLNPAGTPAGTIATLLLDGPAVEAAHFNLLPRRNAASVHLKYTIPTDDEVTAFYAEAAAVEDPVHTFYMACGFHRGYFGMQVNSPTERRIIFSVWDSGAGQTAMKRDGVATDDRTELLDKGEGVNANAFGGEGTGGHSHLKYQWKTGERQRFLLTAAAAANGSAIYSGHWYHPERRAWQKIASFRAPKANRSLKGLHSFSENFVGGNGHLLRKARFCNQWVRTVDGRWLEITEAAFSHDPTGKADRLDRFMGVEDGCFFLSHGGFVEGLTKFGDRFTRPASGKPPGDLPDGL